LIASSKFLKMHKLWWPVIWQTAASHHRHRCFAVISSPAARLIVVQPHRSQTAVAGTAQRSSHNEGAAPPGSPNEAVDKLLDAAITIVQQQQQQRPFLPTRTACETVISLAEAVQASSSPGEVEGGSSSSHASVVQEDKRFQQLLAALETNFASQLEPLAIIREVGDERHQVVRCRN
jgi:hypothetical protein